MSFWIPAEYMPSVADLDARARSLAEKYPRIAPPLDSFSLCHSENPCKGDRSPAPIKSARLLYQTYYPEFDFATALRLEDFSEGCDLCDRNSEREYQKLLACQQDVRDMIEGLDEDLEIPQVNALPTMPAGLTRLAEMIRLVEDEVSRVGAPEDLSYEFCRQAGRSCGLSAWSVCTIAALGYAVTSDIQIYCIIKVLADLLRKLDKAALRLTETCVKI